jgi:hypothetical protein
MADPDQTTSVLAKHFADFKNSRPTEADFAAIGRIALQHTSLEYQLESMVWFYMGDTDKGHIATARMGMTEITDVLQTLVEWTEPDDGVADSIEWAIRCFNILRLNRNSVIHGYNFKADQSTGQLFIEKRSRSIVFDSFDQFVITPEVLAEIIARQSQLSFFIYTLQRKLEMRGPDAIGPNLPPPAEPFPLPARPPEPEKLTPLPREVPESMRSQRKSSLAKAAKLAKIQRKEDQRKAEK